MINLKNKSDSKLTARDQRSRKQKRDDQQNETDTEMLIRISKKFATLFIVILMFDSILDLLTGLIDLLIELLHLVIEFFEYMFEVLLEHIFSAHHHESEIIIANITMALALYLLVRFFLKLPNLFVRLQRNLKAIYLKRKHREICNWRALSLERKIKISLTYSAGLSGFLFLVTL
ncbi:MAG: hypothetical protein K9L22_04340 [Methylococcaceae bacterium]|nr:hypothetical protein [Methylococcaceae bacterium]